MSLKDDDPHEVSLERALLVIAEKKRADAERVIADFPEHNIQVLKGRYGPYVTDGSKNAKIPEGQDPSTLTLKQCLELISKAPEKRKRTNTKKKSPKK